MPHYDYTCAHCHVEFIDVLLPIARRNEPTESPCPACGTGTLERVIAAPRIGDAMRQGRTNLPSAWTDKLSEIKSKHRRSTINVPAPARREI